jgi:hypothetical protein
MNPFTGPPNGWRVKKCLTMQGGVNYDILYENKHIGIAFTREMGNTIANSLNNTVFSRTPAPSGYTGEDIFGPFILDHNPKISQQTIDDLRKIVVRLYDGGFKDPMITFDAAVQMYKKSGIKEAK